MHCPPNQLGIFALGKGLIHSSTSQRWDMKISRPRPGVPSAKRLFHAIPKVSKSHRK
jgi:hypothetical protein